MVSCSGSPLDGPLQLCANKHGRKEPVQKADKHGGKEPVPQSDNFV